MKDTITKQQLLHDYQNVRQQTVSLCQPLAIEDYVIQSIEDVSPPKWHLAHTTWFFETFILKKYLAKYSVFDPTFHYKFNSYYYGLGNLYPRSKRGLLARPTVATVYAYRDYIDKHIADLIANATTPTFTELVALIELGINHEQQHQELLLMDVKYNFAVDPNFPSYMSSKPPVISHSQSQPQLDFISIPETLTEIGSDNSTFSYDNEAPRHKKMLLPYSIATTLVTNGQYCEFIDAGGYQQPKWWLSDGWDCIVKHHWHAPEYWHKIDNDWYIFTLSGLTKLDPNEPVVHISYFEADAYARWRECRLPLEEEWEHFVTQTKLAEVDGNFMETGVYHPQPSTNISKPNPSKQSPQQFYGDVWEWTASSYAPYPGFQPLDGVLGEYNGKFMNNQMVLRGGCCVTPQSHIRASYRNFFQPDKRWQFSGIRLAKNV